MIRPRPWQWDARCLKRCGRSAHGHRRSPWQTHTASGGNFVARNGDLLVFDFTAWGWIMLVWGVLLIATGFGVLSGRPSARFFALLLAFLNAITQIGFLAAFPIWSTIVIALDVFVIFALTARWDEARAAMDE